jgi:hypothetical protein
VIFAGIWCGGLDQDPGTASWALMVSSIAPYLVAPYHLFTSTACLTDLMPVMSSTSPPVQPLDTSAAAEWIHRVVFGAALHEGRCMRRMRIVLEDGIVEVSSRHWGSWLCVWYEYTRHHC